MSSFNLNIEKVVKQSLPGLLVKPKLLSFILSLCAPIEYLHTQFLAYRSQANYNLTINSQVNRLQLALRDKFDLVGINVVTNEASITESFMYTINEEQEQSLIIHTIAENLNPSAIYADIEINNVIDFVVEVPIGSDSLEAAIISFVNRYKLADKKFIIQYV
jgi:hypothetical protein